jgi:hypothetical protein
MHQVDYRVYTRISVDPRISRIEKISAKNGPKLKICIVSISLKVISSSELFRYSHYCLVFAIAIVLQLRN